MSKAPPVSPPPREFAEFRLNIKAPYNTYAVGLPSTPLEKQRGLKARSVAIPEVKSALRRSESPNLYTAETKLPARRKLRLQLHVRGYVKVFSSSESGRR